MGRDYSSSDLDAFARLTDFGTDASRPRPPASPAAPDEPDTVARYSSADLEQFRALSDPDAVNRPKPPARAERPARSPSPGVGRPAPSTAGAPAAARPSRIAGTSGYKDSDLRLFDGILAKDLRRAGLPPATGRAQSPSVDAVATTEFTTGDLEEFDKLMPVSPDALARAERRPGDPVVSNPEPGAGIDQGRIAETMKIVESDAEHRRERANFALGAGRMKIVFSDTGSR